MVTTPRSPGNDTRKIKTHDVASRGATLQVPLPREQVVWHLPSTLPNWVGPRSCTDLRGEPPKVQKGILLAFLRFV